MESYSFRFYKVGNTRDSREIYDDTVTDWVDINVTVLTSE